MLGENVKRANMLGNLVNKMAAVLDMHVNRMICKLDNNMLCNMLMK